MSDSVLGNLGDIVVASTNVGTVEPNSANVKKTSESPENKGFGPCDLTGPGADDVPEVGQQDVAVGTGPEETEPARSRFREVLERCLGEELGPKSNCQGENNTDGVNGVNTEGANHKIGLSVDAAVLSNAVMAGEKSGVKTAARSGISTVDLTETKQKQAAIEGESGKKAGQLHKVDAGYGKVVEGNPAEKGQLRATNQSEIGNQEQAKAGQDQVPVVNDADKEHALGVKLRAANGTTEVNTDMKVVPDEGKPAQNMIRHQVSEEGKMPESNKGVAGEPLKMQAEHTVRVGNDGQNETAPAALRAELKLRTARKSNAQGEELDAAQNQQKPVDGTDVAEASYFKAQIDNVAGVNGLGQHDVASGINAVAAKSQTMGNSVETPTGGVKNVGEQIIDSVAANLRGVDQEIRIMLNPPELGRVRIQFQQRGEEIVGWLQVEKAQTRYEVERGLPQIVAALQQNGVLIKRVEVTQNSFNDTGEHKNNTSDDYRGTGQGELGEQKFDGGGQETEEQNRATRQILTTDGQPHNSEESYKLGDDSINVYV